MDLRIRSTECAKAAKLYHRLAYGTGVAGRAGVCMLCRITSDPRSRDFGPSQCGLRRVPSRSDDHGRRSMRRNLQHGLGLIAANFGIHHDGASYVSYLVAMIP